MTVETISQILWETVTAVMSLSFPVGQYNISFFNLFMFAVIGRILFLFVNRSLDRESEEE